MCDAIVGSRRGMERMEIEIKIGKSSEVVKTFGDFFVGGCVFRLFFVILWLVFYNGLLCLNICI